MSIIVIPFCLSVCLNVCWTFRVLQPTTIDRSQPNLVGRYIPVLGPVYAFLCHRGRHAKIFGWAKSAAYDRRCISDLWHRPITHNNGIGDKQKSCMMCVKFSKEWKTILVTNTTQWCRQKFDLLVTHKKSTRGRFCYEYLPFKLILLTNIQANYWCCLLYTSDAADE